MRVIYYFGYNFSRGEGSMGFGSWGCECDRIKTSEELSNLISEMKDAISKDTGICGDNIVILSISTIPLDC